MKNPVDIRPSWWSPRHEAVWDGARAPVRRDWERSRPLVETGHVNVDSSRDLLGPGGPAPIPPDGAPNTEEALDRSLRAKELAKAVRAELAMQVDATKTWDDSEAVVKYGFGAAISQDRDWASAETDLHHEWADLGHESSWDQDKAEIRFGWDAARNRALRL